MSQVTVTAYTGPGIQATAQVITGVTKVEFDVEAGVLFVYQGNEKISQFATSDVGTVTCTVSGTNFNFVVS